MTIEEMFSEACEKESPMRGHCRTLRDLAAQCGVVVEFGTGDLVSTTSLLAGQPERLTTYDVDPKPEAAKLSEVRGRTEFAATQQSSLDVTPVSCDLLFVDTIHTGRQLYAELKLHGDGVRHWIVLHDTEAFAWWDEIMEEPGLWLGLWRWLRDHGEWRVASVSRESFGLTVLERFR